MYSAKIGLIDLIGAQSHRAIEITLKILDPDLACCPPRAPHTAERDEPSGGIISVATPDSAPPLVPLRSEYERQSYHRPAIWHRHDPLTRRHGPTAAHARAVGHHPPVSRRASRGMPTTRAPAGPRRRRVAWAGARAMHATDSPTAESTRGDASGRPDARAPPSRAGAAGAVACRRGIDGPSEGATSYGWPR